MSKVLTVLLVAAGFGSVSAAPLMWDLRSGSSTPSTVTGSGEGNLISYVNNGVTVTVSSWGLTGSGNTKFEEGTTGRWSAGIGVCNEKEGVGCGSPSHQVDNANGVDFILFQFSAPVNLGTIQIQPYGKYDTDVSYFLGNPSGSLDLTGTTIAGLSSLGFGSAINNLSSPSTSGRTINVSSDSAVTAILFGARLSGGDSKSDYFKIQTLTACPEPPSAVPEPATLGFVGVGLAAAGLIRRRASRARG